MSTIPGTILEQLGGHRFLTMTGARALATSGGRDLGFRLPSRFANQGINHVRVLLDADDTYTVTYSKIWGHKVRVIAEESMLHADMLRDCFTAVTGLDTSL